MSLYTTELKIKTTLEELERAMSQTFQDDIPEYTRIRRVQQSLARACGYLYEVIDRPKNE